MEEERKKYFYSRFAKTTVLVLQAFCMIGLILAMTLVIYGINWVGSIEDFTQNSVYEETTGCADKIANQIHRHSDYGRYKNLFETNGRYDENKTIDIFDLSNFDKKRQDEKTSYTVKNLRSMQEHTETDDIEMILSEIGDMDTEEVSKDTLEYWENVIGNQQTVAKESLKEVLKGETESYCYQYLLHLEEVLDELDVYLEGRNANLESNLKFFVRDTDTGNVYTNVGEWENLEQLPNDQTNLVLLSYTRIEGKIEFDEAATTAAQQYLQNFFRDDVVLGENEQGFIALDCSYPIEDTLKINHDSYEKYQPYFEVSVILSIICFVLWILGLLVATLQTGRNERNNEITLGKFDRIPTEIAAVAALFIGGWLLSIAVSVSSGYSVAFVIVTEAVIITVGTLVFMWAYLSLVRRMKAKVLWSNSITKTILSMCKQVYQARSMSGRLILIFAGFSLFHIVMVGAGGGFGIFIVLLCDIVILLHLLKEAAGKETVKEGIQRLAEGELDSKIVLDTLQGENLELAKKVNRIGDGMKLAVERAMKDERMKAELITNVSHDIKTPLTSIINYVDLLKRENLEDPKIQGYLEILERKSQRLKQLTEDLVEVSKASTGNIELHMSQIQVQQLLKQAYGEFGEKLSAKGLVQKLNLADESVVIWADGKQLWRIFENLLNNIAKYAMPHTRVYIDLQTDGEFMVLTFKNISEYPLEVEANELTERFIRGDASRSTEGSGLGLSIAKSLTELQHGTFEIYLDGDLFKVTLTFKRQIEEKSVN